MPPDGEWKKRRRLASRWHGRTGRRGGASGSSPAGEAVPHGRHRPAGGGAFWIPVRRCPTARSPPHRAEIGITPIRGDATSERSCSTRCVVVLAIRRKSEKKELTHFRRQGRPNEFPMR